MVAQKILSESEEMYLVTIRRFCEHCPDSPVPIPEVAKKLGIQPVSANQMVNKLSEYGLVEYFPYKGVQLTETGRKISTRILRHRRLWEVFLVRSLKMNINEADKLACQLEHLTTSDLANRLSDFLENPTVCYHGDPITPAEEEEVRFFEGLPLENLKIGESALVINIDADALTARFLWDEGIRPGVRIRLLAVGANGKCLIESEENRSQLSVDLLPAIIINPINQLEESIEKEKA